ncbi:hypothetical protein M5K25_015976 [Dendrobium thyrsiflorum]|uniref:Uncharacterized protein n=1 Tax=Dendrobium thyrsiflorum TaxID=117978 RepID=A0ABD0URZ9_DENTH
MDSTRSEDVREDSCTGEGIGTYMSFGGYGRMQLCWESAQGLWIGSLSAYELGTLSETENSTLRCNGHSSMMLWTHFETRTQRRGAVGPTPQHYEPA